MKQYILYGILSLAFLSGCEIHDHEPYDLRREYTGTYNVDETSHTLGVTSPYVVDVILSNSNDTAIIITNFYNAGIELSAIVYGNKLTIPFQKFQRIGIYGFGSLSQGVLTITYNVDRGDDNMIEELTATCRRR